MPLESANFIDGLVITNPPGTDLKSQGDDHLQLIKKVLKNTFPNATRPFPIPTAITVTTSSSVTAANQNSLLIINNSAAMTLTMPALATTDAGWFVNVIKLPSSTGALFIAPPSGNIISGAATVAKARRNIPGVQFQVLWTGSNWVAQRCVLGPIGSIVPFFTAALPTGFEWPNGQTLVSADYPEYVSLKGDAVTPDLRQRTIFGTDLGGANSGRITTVFPTPTLGTAGGSQFFHSHNHGGLTGLENQAHTHNGVTGGNNESLDHTHFYVTPVIIAIPQGTINPAGYGASSAGANTGTASFGVGSHTHSFSTSGELQNHNHNIAPEGAGTSQNMPPTLICNYALVVE